MDAFLRDSEYPRSGSRSISKQNKVIVKKDRVEHENEGERGPEIILQEASPNGVRIHLMQ
jgi:hypothetical protein